MLLSLKMANISNLPHRFVHPQLVRGLRSQTDLEEEGASCQVLARHALSRWTQAWRWARGERTTVAPDLDSKHHRQKTNFLGPSICKLDILRVCGDVFCSDFILGGTFSLLRVSFEQLPFIRMLKGVQSPATKGLCFSFTVSISVSLLPLDRTCNSQKSVCV